ncbi:AzlD family protein [Rhizobiales bacterium]|uniref:AzlD family protein n=1 Tax=Hongsoonwoonella zoysiae TaxID=2821844 RepID=UPI00155FA70C|nr:AzlD family protein [Hongsoonwoonella zoysiae]NRG17855.1 AzlD family protein [Hongsoonwoonella zoysiae]
MSIEPTTLFVILGMAAATYFTRIAGFVLVSHVHMGKRLETALQAVPPAVLMSVIAPTAFASGYAEAGATAITAVAAFRLPLLAVIAVGVGSLLVLRAVVG